MVRLALVTMTLAALACGDDDAPTPALAPTPAVVPPQPAPAPAETPPPPPIDLIQSVPASVAVSSAYRGREEQAAKLVDEDIETAWNSRTGELAGAWIEIRLPAEVQVDFIEMTAGFTKVGSSDLFTGNHRISKVRVSRDGASLGEHALDIESRQLQRLDVSGPGGVYRIEVVATEPGSRSDWREVCVSDLRVMGQPGDVARTHGHPRVAIGALPPLPSADDPAEPTGDLDSLEATLGDVFVAWGRYDEALIGADFTTGDPGISSEEAEDLADQRAEIFGQVADLLEPSNAAQAAELRRYAEANREWRWRDRRLDLEPIVRALDALVDEADDELLSCNWRQLHVTILLSRVDALASWDQEVAEVWESEAYESDDDSEIAEAERASEAAANAYERYEEILDAWSDDREEEGARLIRRASRPSSELVAPEWELILDQLDATARACDW